MDLVEILTKAGGGFLTGLSWGVTGIGSRSHEEIERAESNFSPEEMREYSPRITELKKERRRAKIYAPLAAGSLFSFAESQLSEENSLGGHAASILFAYAGMAAGASLRRAIQKKFGSSGLEIARNLRDDPENAFEYIPAKQKKALEEVFKEVEDIFLEDPDFPIDRLKEKNGPLSKMKRIILHGQGDYAYALLSRSYERLNDTIHCAKMQWRVRDFFEDSEPLKAMILGDADRDLLRVYEFDGHELKVYSTKPKLVQLVESGKTTLSGSLEEINVHERMKWDKDYKGLAKRITGDQKANSVALVRSSPEIPPQFVLLTLAQLYSIARDDNIGEIDQTISPFPEQGWGDGYSLN